MSCRVRFLSALEKIMSGSDDDWVKQTSAVTSAMREFDRYLLDPPAVRRNVD
jgi:hypothetical protein